MVNVDVAYEILRYLSPTDRCRLRLVSRSFNEACLLWWRRMSVSVDVGRTIAANRRRRSKILSFLRFLSKHCSSIVKKLTNFSVDSHLLKGVIQASWIDELLALFNFVEELDVRWLQMENYDDLATFLNLFQASALSSLKITARYPMPALAWDSDETTLCAATVKLTGLRQLHLREMELKGDLLTSLNANLVDLIIESCPDVEEDNLVTMAAWCVHLERLRLVDVFMSVDAFRHLCSMPALRTLNVSNSRIVVDSDWLRCVCSSESIQMATITGRVQEDSFGDLLDSCPWPLMITVADYSYKPGECDQLAMYCLALQNPLCTESLCE